MTLANQIAFSVAFLSLCLMALGGMGLWLLADNNRLKEKANDQARALRTVTETWRNTNELVIGMTRYLYDTKQIDKFRVWYRTADVAELQRDIRSARHARALKEDGDMLIPPRTHGPVPHPNLPHEDGPIIDGDLEPDVILVDKIGQAMVPTRH